MEFVALLVAAVALVFSVIALRRTARMPRQAGTRPTSTRVDAVDSTGPMRSTGPRVMASTAATDDVAAGSPIRNAPADALNQVPPEIQNQLDSLGLALATSMRHFAVVRYDAFDDVTGRMSFTAAILDDYGDGIVITSLHTRSESRTLLKGITGGTAGGLSPEEQQAVDRAMGEP